MLRFFQKYLIQIYNYNFKVGYNEEIFSVLEKSLIHYEFQNIIFDTSN